MVKQMKERNLNKNNKTPLYYARNPPTWTVRSKSDKMEQRLLSKGAQE